MKTMKALLFKDIGKIDFEEIALPQVSEQNQVLVKVAACGICGTDVKILEGKHAYKKNVVLGHEFTGEVVEIGTAVTAVALGDRVALDNNSRCGVCEFCRSGQSSQCTELKNRTLGVFQNGGYAEYVLATEDVCFKIPDSLDDITATQVETLATVLNGMNIVQMQPYDSVLVLGCGPIGYLFTAIARNVGTKVVTTEIDPFRLDIAKKFGHTVLNPEECDLEAEVLRLTNGKKFDIVIDAIGTQLANAIKYVTPGGKVLAFGMDSSIDVTIKPYDITRNAIKVLGSYIGQNTMVPAIDMLDAKQLEMDNFFTGTVSLKDGPAAFTKLGLDLKSMDHVAKSAMKIVLIP